MKNTIKFCIQLDVRIELIFSKKINLLFETSYFFLHLLKELVNVCNIQSDTACCWKCFYFFNIIINDVELIIKYNFFHFNLDKIWDLILNFFFKLLVIKFKIEYRIILLNLFSPHFTLSYQQI